MRSANSVEHALWLLSPWSSNGPCLDDDRVVQPQRQEAGSKAATQGVALRVLLVR